MELIITKDNYASEVLSSNRPVLIDFFANWCGPCKMLSPILKELAQEHPEIKLGKVNVDEEIELANNFHVASIPMLVLVKDGAVVKTSVGYRPKADIEAMLK